MNRSAFAIGVILLIVGLYLALMAKQKAIGVLLCILGAYLVVMFRKISL